MTGQPRPNAQPEASRWGRWGGSTPPPGGSGDRCQVLTREQVQAMVRAAHAGWHRSHPERDAALVAFLYATGCRVSEASDMWLEYVDLDAVVMDGDDYVTTGCCDIWRRKVGNWLLRQALGSSRDLLLAYVRPRLLRAKLPREPLFLSSQGRNAAMGERAIQRMVRRAGELAGLPEGLCHPHALRHARGTHMAEAGVPTALIQHQLGHAHLSSTQRYLAPSRGVVARAAVDTDITHGKDRDNANGGLATRLDP